jgi:hypothetical protein
VEAQQGPRRPSRRCLDRGSRQSGRLFTVTPLGRSVWTAVRMAGWDGFAERLPDTDQLDRFNPSFPGSRLQPITPFMGFPWHVASIAQLTSIRVSSRMPASRRAAGKQQYYPAARRLTSMTTGIVAADERLTKLGHLWVLVIITLMELYNTHATDTHGGTWREMQTHLSRIGRVPSGS